MLRRTCLALAASLFLPVAALGGPVEDLARALDLPRLFRVLTEEGIDYGASLEAELFPGSGGARWAAIVGGIHETGRLESLAMARLRAELEPRPEAVARMTAYFAADPGARIVALEIAAREALLDDAVTEAAAQAHEEMLAREDPRLSQLDRLIEANDLIEQNVAGALNSNLAFYRGMIAGGAVEATLPEAELMADLWSQEPQIRQDAVDWLMPFMVLAYGPLPDADLEGYIAFSQSPEGQILNRALFAAFNETFDVVARDLGLAAARFLQGQDL